MTCKNIIEDIERQLDSLDSEFQTTRVTPLPEINAACIELQHQPTGAKFIHIDTEDRENTFGVALKTVPEDSTGVAHILEHTVLCGSNEYPVRDPFFSMLKRSLNTFMNAFTASDWTMYPFCTQNKKDYYNLMSVYLDAVFFPNIDRLSFKQEGHRLDIEENMPSTPQQGQNGSWRLVYKGVVYNEMKGAMSSPDQVCKRSLLSALYPDTTYRFNSGGEPADIPRLSYDQLLAFHKRHYHPSNAFFYSYGNFNLIEQLSFIDKKVLQHFNRVDPKTEVPSQPRWQTPREETYYYPLSAQEDPQKKCQISLAWLTADIKDAYEVLVLSLLEDILLGNAASPMRKALIDSGLGSSLCDATGFDSDNRDTLFAFGLKDVEKESASKISDIILSVLEKLAAQGIDPDLINAAIHQIEFHRKEITNTPYPYGLKLFLTVCGAWFHGGEPARVLQFDADLERLRKEVDQGGFFERKIRQYFLENTHRVLFRLLPDQAMAQREEARIEKELATLATKIGASDLERIREDAAALLKLQEKEENLSCLPTLERADIPPTIHTVAESGRFRPEKNVCYEASTAGIFYFSAAMGMGGLSSDLIPLIPFFCYAFNKVGTAKRDYVEMAKRVDAYTGGVGIGAHVRTVVDGNGNYLPFMLLEGKCLSRNQERMFDIVEEFTQQFDFKNQDRLQQLLKEYRSGLESMVVQNGHRLAISLAARRFLSKAALSETWYGVSQLRYIKSLVFELDDCRLSKMTGDLTAIAQKLFLRENIKTAYIGEPTDLEKSLSFDTAYLDKLPSYPNGNTSLLFSPPKMEAVDDSLPHEGWYTSSSVSFVAKTFQTVSMGHSDAPALAVISKLLRSLFLHREIREKGGAYGGFSLYAPEDGLFSFASYRDPHILRTLKAFESASEFICSGNYTDQDINEALLQVCSEIDKPDPPGPSARKAFLRKIISLTDEVRREYKRDLLSLNKEKVMAVADRYFGKNGQNQAVAVISGKEQLEKANTMLGEKALSLQAI